MKTPEEIKKGLVEAIEDASCVVEYGDAHDLIDAVEKNHAIMADALAYIKQLEAQVPKWISVEDELPEEPCAVLVVLRGNAAGVAWYCKKYFETGSGLCFSAGNGITHWMPLPEPPPKEE